MKIDVTTRATWSWYGRTSLSGTPSARSNLANSASSATKRWRRSTRSSRRKAKVETSPSGIAMRSSSGANERKSITLSGLTRKPGRSEHDHQRAKYSAAKIAETESSTVPSTRSWSASSCGSVCSV